MDHLSYPHIMDEILATAPYDSLIALRAASSDMRAHIDPVLAKRMQVSLPQSTMGEKEGPLLVTYGANVPIARYPSSPSASCSSQPDEILSTQLKQHADVLAVAHVVDLLSPAQHYRLWKLYPFLSGTHTLRYRGPDLYTTASAKTTVSGRHIVDRFFIPLSATRIITSLDADTPPQTKLIAYPILPQPHHTIINMWWSPTRPELSAAHHCNLVRELEIRNLVFLFRQKPSSSVTDVSPVPSEPSECAPNLQKMGMLHNLLKSGVGRIFAPDCSTALTFVGLEGVAPAALGYTDNEPSLASIIDDMLEFLTAEGIGEKPDGSGPSHALLQGRVRFLSHQEYAQEVGEEDYDIQMMPPPS
ncbi:hypothetical protein CspeluHIS016_0901910 [Cutaneotrichosporon spelunceum]|uniref:Uncharacterized protein n=1 Tax=Cutaneotrichosporon spelunceum TaxID=1672016 RepID=A0AAD3U0D9_9TREE|nr:hypothetical protein CspeluHIS016_0901910 [Cutaneotrichosporon spelunceum]